MDLKLLIKKKSTIAIIMVIFVLIAFIVTMFQPLRYGAKSKLLIVQNVPAGSDPYALSRSNAYLGVILSQVIVTNSFYNEVINGEFGIQRRHFETNNDIEKITKKWRKAVSAKAAGDTGIIEISVVHPDKQQAEAIANGVFQTLVLKHTQFHGGGDNIKIKTIDSPIISQVSPNISLNFSVALLAGVVISLFYVVQYPGDEHDLKLSQKTSITN